MRPRRTAQDEIAAIARRRLELLSAELAELREAAGQPTDDGADGASGAGAPRAEASDPARRGVEGTDEGTREPAVAPGRPGRHARRPVSRVRRVGGWVQDRLPPTLQGRVGLGHTHLTVVAVMVALALGVTAWWVVRAEGTTTVVPVRGEARVEYSAPALVTPAPGVASGVEPGVAPGVAPSGAPVGDGPAADPATLVVDVAGKVRRPGIATLPVGSRVIDAIESAGGVRRGVDLTTLNLARLLVDGEQVVVGVPPPGGVAAPAASAPTAGGVSGGTAATLVNINTAAQSELEELPGVGPVTASAILQWRTENGPFTSVDELMEVSGIGEKTLAEIAPHVTL